MKSSVFQRQARPTAGTVIETENLPHMTVGRAAGILLRQLDDGFGVGPCQLLHQPFPVVFALIDGDIIVWKYLKLHIQFSRFVGSGFRSLSGPVRFRDIIVSYFRRKVYGLVVQVTHPLSPCIVYNALKKAKKFPSESKTFALPSDGMSFYASSINSKSHCPAAAL